MLKNILFTQTTIYQHLISNKKISFKQRNQKLMITAVLQYQLRGKRNTFGMAPKNSSFFYCKYSIQVT